MRKKRRIIGIREEKEKMKEVKRGGTGNKEDMGYCIRKGRG